MVVVEAVAAVVGSSVSSITYKDGKVQGHKRARDSS